MRYSFAPSIFLRLYSVQLLAVTLAWAVFAGVTLVDAHRAASQQLTADQRLLAGSLARLTSRAPNADLAMELGETFRVLEVRDSPIPLKQSELSYAVWKADGTLIARSPEAPPVGIASLPLGQRVMRSGWMLLADSSADGRVIAMVGESPSYLQRVSNAASRKILYPYFILAAALASVVWVALRYGLRPLRKLADLVAARGATDLRPLEPTPRYRELEPLTDALNGTLARIRRLVEAEREFFADAAHELRTPLAVIGAQAHVVAHEPSEPGRRAAATALDEGIRRATNVLQRLLVLARLDAAMSAPKVELTDLAELVRDVATVRSAYAEASGHTLEVTVETPLEGRCNPTDLRMALDCLVDNALKHTQPGTRICMVAAREGDEGVLSVSDDGPGIPEELRERAFRRFERLGVTDPEGSGLGLAIVRRVAELHGGRVDLRGGHGGRGCGFEIRIPLFLPW